jgi:hypothetical protein
MHEHVRCDVRPDPPCVSCLRSVPVLPRSILDSRLFGWSRRVRATCTQRSLNVVRDCTTLCAQCLNVTVACNCCSRHPFFVHHHCTILYVRYSNTLYPCSGSLTNSSTRVQPSNRRGFVSQTSPRTTQLMTTAATLSRFRTFALSLAFALCF